MYNPNQAFGSTYQYQQIPYPQQVQQMPIIQPPYPYGYYPYPPQQMNILPLNNQQYGTGQELNQQKPQIEGDKISYYAIIEVQINVDDRDLQLEEIVEVGFVVVCDMDVIHQKSWSVKPTFYKQIFSKTEKLTGIKTDSVKESPTIEQVINDIEKYINKILQTKQNQITFVTMFEETFLWCIRQEEQHKNFKLPQFMNKFYALDKNFPIELLDKKSPNPTYQNMLQSLKLTHHQVLGKENLNSATAHARDTAHILIEILKKGFTLTQIQNYSEQKNLKNKRTDIYYYNEKSLVTEIKNKETKPIQEDSDDQNIKSQKNSKQVEKQKQDIKQQEELQGSTQKNNDQTGSLKEALMEQKALYDKEIQLEKNKNQNSQNSQSKEENKRYNNISQKNDRKNYQYDEQNNNYELHQRKKEIFENREKFDRDERNQRNNNYDNYYEYQDSNQGRNQQQYKQQNNQIQNRESKNNYQKRPYSQEQKYFGEERNLYNSQKPNKNLQKFESEYISYGKPKQQVNLSQKQLHIRHQDLKQDLKALILIDLWFNQEQLHISVVIKIKYLAENNNNQPNIKVFRINDRKQQILALEEAIYLIEKEISDTKLEPSEFAFVHNNNSFYYQKFFNIFNNKNIELKEYWHRQINIYDLIVELYGTKPASRTLDDILTFLGNQQGSFQNNGNLQKRIILLNSITDELIKQNLQWSSQYIKSYYEINGNFLTPFQEKIKSQKQYNQNIEDKEEKEFQIALQNSLNENNLKTDEVEKNQDERILE